MGEMTWREWAEQVATGMVLVGADLRVRWVNPALAERLELGAHSATGQPLSWLMPDLDAIAQARRALVGQRAVHWRSVELAVPGGRVLSADVQAQPLDGGLLLEVHALAEPVASVSPLSATLRGFAHEVKNPLAGLRGAAQLLHRRVDNDDLRALAGLIIDEADRLGTLANRLLHHDGAVQLGPVSIHQLLERLADLLEAEATAPRVHHDYDPSVPDLLGDADRLHQVLLNLVRNALEAGARTLTFRTRVEHGVRLGQRLLRTALRVDVIDDGAGIPAALRDTLFEPLVSGRAGGTGLGLALSREIAHEHGGQARNHAIGTEPRHALFELGLDLLGDRYARHLCCCHARASFQWKKCRVPVK